MGVIDPTKDAAAPLPAGLNQDLIMRQVTGELHEKGFLISKSNIKHTTGKYFLRSTR